MTVLTIAIDEPLDIEARLRLKNELADAFRLATATQDEIGVDVVPLLGRG